METTEPDPWLVPLSDEGRTTLERLAEKYDEAGKVRESGCTLSRLAYMYKHHGTGWDEMPAYTASVDAALQAVALLRQTDDRAGLAEALRRAAQPFIKGLKSQLFPFSSEKV